MKKFTILSIFVLLFALVAPMNSAQAGSYKSKVLSVCPYCKQNVYAYYRPISYYGAVRYVWVPAYHTTCQARANSIRYQSQRYRPSRSYSPSYNYGGRRSGFSIHIR